MAKSNDLLAVLLGGRPLGTLRRTAGARGGWWLEYLAAASTPLSVSLPLEAGRFKVRRTERWLQGLLPDNAMVLDNWARRFGESPLHPVDLLRHVGEDVAGAVQFVRTERVGPIARGELDDLTWLAEADVEHRIQALKAERGDWRLSGDAGQFSLAGAQTKTALYYDSVSKRWGLPAGRVPTTHILKPPIPRFEGHAANEHFCLRLATLVGLDAATTEVRQFGTETVIVVTRYDRLAGEGLPRRVHQEDLCQAAGVEPGRKYESDGGPKARELAKLLHRETGDAAVQKFFDALVFNWLVGGTDAHAKNYSILLSGKATAFAPLYDIASILPYGHNMEPKLAMKIGGENRVLCLTPKHWKHEAKRFGLRPDDAIERVRSLAEACRERVDALRRECTAEGVDTSATYAAVRNHIDRVLASWPTG